MDTKPKSNPIKFVKLPDLFTLANAAAGFLSIIFAINQKLSIAAIMLLIAVFFDYLDGKSTRIFKKQSSFGKELDSLADVISFGVAPAVFGYSVINSNFAVVVFVIFLLSGILRLARYNISKTTISFQGLPITVNGIIIPFIYFININPIFYPYIYLLSSILMISSFKLKKVI